MELTEAQAASEAVALGAELDKRISTFKKVESYYTADCPIPASIQRANVTQAYRMLMAFAQTNYGRLIIKAATSRLQVGGVRSEDKDADNAVWGVWQDNRMAAESRRGHDNALTHGRVHAIVWPEDADQESPRITLEPADTVIVRYREGSRYERLSAMRRWIDDDKVQHATIYTADFIYKLSGEKAADGVYGNKWVPRLVDGEDWPLENPTGEVPVVEVGVNRRLKCGSFGDACGDYEGSIGLLDRINVLEFLRLVIAFTAGFPIRAVIGDEILKDDNDVAIAPFKLAADTIAQFENPDVKIVELAAADIKSFGEAIDHDVETLAGITQTPSYYLRSIPIQNVSADAIRASDSPLNSRVEDHKPDLAEGWQEVLRIAGLMLPEPVELSQRAEIIWVNRESRSLSERADAATKLKDIMPWQFIAENVFELGQDEINRLETQRASDQITALLAAPAPTPALPAST